MAGVGIFYKFAYLVNMVKMVSEDIPMVRSSGKCCLQPGLAPQIEQLVCPCSMQAPSKQGLMDVRGGSPEGRKT